PTAAQVQGGNLYGRALDEKGQPLPGATLLLSGPGTQLIAPSDPLGQFRFLGLPPGRYQLEVRLTGFSPFRYGDLVLAVAHNTTLEVTLTAVLAESLRVTAASPLLDERRVVTGTTLTSTQLEKVPTARDPWALLNQVPGVLLDRINVGGNESNCQA